MEFIVSGLITFAVLIAATALIARSYGSKSSVFRLCIAAIADFVLQGALGFIAFGSATVVVIHLTNAFILAVIVSNLIVLADRPLTAQVPAAKPPGM